MLPILYHPVLSYYFPLDWQSYAHACFKSVLRLTGYKTNDCLLTYLKWRHSFIWKSSSNNYYCSSSYFNSYYCNFWYCILLLWQLAL